MIQVRLFEGLNSVNHLSHFMKLQLLDIQVRKGDTIGEFLRAIQQQLASEFREIRTTSVENLLYVKEDLIIPHVSLFCLILISIKSLTATSYFAFLFCGHLEFQQHSFYELIINKARGKSGPVMFKLMRIILKFMHLCLFIYYFNFLIQLIE